VKIAEEKIADIIGFTNTLIPLDAEERRVFPNLRKQMYYIDDGDPQLYQGQVLASRYTDNIKERIPQSLINKTHSALRKLIGKVYIPALPEQLTVLISGEPEKLLSMVYKYTKKDQLQIDAALYMEDINKNRWREGAQDEEDSTVIYVAMDIIQKVMKDIG
jgi:hypothetical protein